MLLRRALLSSRYVVLIAIVMSMLGAISLLLYEAAVIVGAVVQTVQAVQAGVIGPKAAKVLAVGLVEGLDIFLIAIVAYIISVGLYVLFIDRTLPLPGWLKINDLGDLKSHLVSSVIAVLAVLFLREAVAWDGERNLLAFGAALAVIIAALTLYLAVKGRH